MFKTIKIIKELSIVLLPLEQIKQIEIFTAGIMSEDEMVDFLVDINIINSLPIDLSKHVIQYI